MTNEERQQAIEWLKRRPVMMAGAKRMYNLAVEALEAYVPDMNVGRWIPVGERLPEEKINPNTSDFEEVLCSTTFGDVRAYKFGTPYGWEKPHFWRGLNVMDEYVLAWMEKPKPWKGEQDGKA